MDLGGRPWCQGLTARRNLNAFQANEQTNRGRREEQRRGRGGASPSEELSRPGGPILPFSFLPKSRPMDDLMLFFLGALCRESGVPSLGKQGHEGRPSLGWGEVPPPPPPALLGPQPC